MIQQRYCYLWVISPDGQRHIQLLSSKDGLVNPFVLDYDKSTNKLLVVNEERTAFKIILCITTYHRTISGRRIFNLLY
jgi:hypothetical protein